MDLMSLVQMATPAQTQPLNQVQPDNQPDDSKEQSGLFTSALAGHITDVFNRAEMARNQDLTQRLLTCQRLRRGEYSPQEKASIDKQGGSDVFVNLTNIKCRAAESWIKDIMLSQGNDKPWTLDPTPIPDLPPEVNVEVSRTVALEQQALAAQGMDVHPDAFEERRKEIHDELIQRINDIASDRVKNMERKIDDQMKEGNFLKAFKDFINDFVTFPTAFLKGPVVRMRNVVTWGEQGPVVAKKTVGVRAREPFDIYPAPDAISVQDGPLIQRHRLFPTALEALKNVEGYKTEAIETILEPLRQERLPGAPRVRHRARPARGPPDLWRWRTATRSRPSSTGVRCVAPTLKQWAGADAEKLGFDELEDNTFYEIEAWLIGAR
jgi:hypothetical protein